MEQARPGKFSVQLSCFNPSGSATKHKEFADDFSSGGCRWRKMTKVWVILVNSGIYVWFCRPLGFKECGLCVYWVV